MVCGGLQGAVLEMCVRGSLGTRGCLRTIREVLRFRQARAMHGHVSVHCWLGAGGTDRQAGSRLGGPIVQAADQDAPQMARTGFITMVVSSRSGYAHFGAGWLIIESCVVCFAF